MEPQGCLLAVHAKPFCSTREVNHELMTVRLLDCVPCRKLGPKPRRCGTHARFHFVLHVPAC
jgi:hypothetical protein